jgi:hypothetical protein
MMRLYRSSSDQTATIGSHFPIDFNHVTALAQGAGIAHMEKHLTCIKTVLLITHMTVKTDCSKKVLLAGLHQTFSITKSDKFNSFPYFKFTTGTLKKSPTKINLMCN